MTWREALRFWWEKARPQRAPVGRRRSEGWDAARRQQWLLAGAGKIAGVLCLSLLFILFRGGQDYLRESGLSLNILLSGVTPEIGKVAVTEERRRIDLLFPGGVQVDHLKIGCAKALRLSDASRANGETGAWCLMMTCIFREFGQEWQQLPLDKVVLVKGRRGSWSAISPEVEVSRFGVLSTCPCDR
jgi:hypothetical protein